jgi:cysteine sulfinate desulfinase/cysteine desulfurase-like protein
MMYASQWLTCSTMVLLAVTTFSVKVLLQINHIALQEHKCVLDSCRSMEMEGFDVTYLPVQKNGIIDLKV